MTFQLPQSKCHLISVAGKVPFGLSSSLMSCSDTSALLTVFQPNPSTLSLYTTGTLLPQGFRLSLSLACSSHRWWWVAHSRIFMTMLKFTSSERPPSPLCDGSGMQWVRSRCLPGEGNTTRGKQWPFCLFGPWLPHGGIVYGPWAYSFKCLRWSEIFIGRGKLQGRVTRWEGRPETATG